LKRGDRIVGDGELGGEVAIDDRDDKDEPPKDSQDSLLPVELGEEGDPGASLVGDRHSRQVSLEDLREV